MRRLLTIHLKPCSNRNELISHNGNVWTIRLTAAPVDNKANKALVDFLAKKLNLPKSFISIVQGHTSKTKIVKINTH